MYNERLWRLETEIWRQEDEQDKEWTRIGLRINAEDDSAPDTLTNTQRKAFNTVGRIRADTAFRRNQALRFRIGMILVKRDDTEVDDILEASEAAGRALHFDWDVVDFQDLTKLTSNEGRLLSLEDGAVNRELHAGIYTRAGEEDPELWMKELAALGVMARNRADALAWRQHAVRYRQGMCLVMAGVTDDVVAAAKEMTERLKRLSTFPANGHEMFEEDEEVVLPGSLTMLNRVYPMNGTRRMAHLASTNPAPMTVAPPSADDQAAQAEWESADDEMNNLRNASGMVPSAALVDLQHEQERNLQDSIMGDEGDMFSTS